MPISRTGRPSRPSVRSSSAVSSSGPRVSVYFGDGLGLLTSSGPARIGGLLLHDALGLGSRSAVNQPATSLILALRLCSCGPPRWRSGLTSHPSYRRSHPVLQLQGRGGSTRIGPRLPEACRFARSGESRKTLVGFSMQRRKPTSIQGRIAQEWACVSRTHGKQAGKVLQMDVGEQVEVHTRFNDSWVPGFEIAEVADRGFACAAGPTARCCPM